MKEFYFTIEERMEIQQKQTMWDYPWHAFCLSLPNGKPILFWNRTDGYDKGIYAYGRMYGDDFCYHACSKKELSHWWNYYIDVVKANPCYHLTQRGEAKKPEEAAYEVYLSKINPVEAYIKKMTGSWLAGGFKWKKTVKEILDDSNKQTCA